MEKNNIGKLVYLPQDSSLFSFTSADEKDIDVLIKPKPIPFKLVKTPDSSIGVIVDETLKYYKVFYQSKYFWALKDRVNVMED